MYYACCPEPDSFHDVTECQTSTYTQCREIQLEPLSSTDPTPLDRGSLAMEGSQLGAAAAVGDFMAIETESDEAPWWLVKVVKTAQNVPGHYTCPDLHSDVEFEYPRGKQAVMVTRLRPAATGRGGNSTRLFELDTTIRPSLIPCHLIRVGKIKLIQSAAPGMRRSARTASRGGGGGRGAAFQYELKAEIKAQIYERCRCWGTT